MTLSSCFAAIGWSVVNRCLWAGVWLGNRMLFLPKNPSMAPDDFQRFVAPVQRRRVDGVWRIVRDVQETEDVMQEVLVQVFERFEEVRRHPNPTALLLR